jgi:hypothetical protein
VREDVDSLDAPNWLIQDEMGLDFDFAGVFSYPGFRL